MANESSLDRVEAETLTDFHGNSSCLVEDRVDSTDHDKTKQKSLFCQFFSVYLKENCSRGNLRPVPVTLGDGQLLDLYHLFSLVKENGGYDAVSRKGLWDFVLVELGLNLHVLALVKLVYEKYLNDFEGWLSNTFKGNAASCLEISAEDFNSRKRELESSFGMVTWTRHIAKHPLDPAAKLLPEPSKWEERDILSMRKHVELNRGSSSQKVKMHSAMYEDPVALSHQGTKKLRSSKRLRSPGNRNKCLLDKNTAKPDVAEKKKFMSSLGGFHETSVPIGSHFQVEVPEWTGVASESDPKWLGTQVWPVKDDSKPTTETDLVGRGRRGKCSCNVRGSVDCVRFHIAGNRMKLKHELRSVFYLWGFDRMGEGVSLQWTAEEEKKFKDLMRLNIPSDNKDYWIDFWNNTSEEFQMKTRKDLVNYYLNVYLVQQRSYQNRVTPKTADSDDGEVKFGSFGDGFGRKAIKHRSLEFMECSENTQCFDFE
ncbi:AT-rich interactive domain-containing protein 2-like [Vicia villosa]|uniref:AT-rich interactive domain-containing protein 2-like n=1 Tax=Vicia villosa TaxID=3911 RepID=UPI00273B6BA3|nr:AT-rich interactive domain-containing protein 2-like [Vicia villosa]XP_058732037.1 AT-rich interactive domain-containing protein 2-like [Vicia villosa]XP_058732038.1 AT-rich interactive domain-containing protein 2-like [Vicia villosa]